MLQLASKAGNLSELVVRLQADGIKFNNDQNNSSCPKIVSPMIQNLNSPMGKTGLEPGGPNIQANMGESKFQYR